MSNRSPLSQLCEEVPHLVAALLVGEVGGEGGKHDIVDFRATCPAALRKVVRDERVAVLVHRRPRTVRRLREGRPGQAQGAALARREGCQGQGGALLQVPPGRLTTGRSPKRRTVRPGAEAFAETPNGSSGRRSVRRRVRRNRVRSSLALGKGPRTGRDKMRPILSAATRAATPETDFSTESPQPSMGSVAIRLIRPEPSALRGAHLRDWSALAARQQPGGRYTQWAMYRGRYCRRPSERSCLGCRTTSSPTRDPYRPRKSSSETVL